jgi:hypothetical protein
MEEQLLKGNFKVKTPVKIDEEKSASSQEEYKKRALASIGGSMVYMERTKLTWDGDK